MLLEIITDLIQIIICSTIVGICHFSIFRHNIPKNCCSEILIIIFQNRKVICWCTSVITDNDNKKINQSTVNREKIVLIIIKPYAQM